jgi:hypothetical protein
MTVCHGLDSINTQLEGLEIRTGEIQDTLNTHVTRWQLQQQQKMAQMNALLKQQYDQ